MTVQYEFQQAYRAVALPEAVTVVVTVSPRPAILKLTARLPALSGPAARALTKCGAAANAGPAASIRVSLGDRVTDGRCGAGSDAHGADLARQPDWARLRFRNCRRLGAAGVGLISALR